MNKNIKKLNCVILSIIMIVASIVPSFTAYADDKHSGIVDGTEYDSNMDKHPFLRGDSYFRVSNNKWTEFDTNYDNVVANVQKQMANKSSNIEINFATKDTKYQYDSNNDENETINATCELLMNDILNSVFTTNLDNPKYGDYLYKSIYHLNYGYNAYTTSLDNPSDGNDRYYTFTISFKGDDEIAGDAGIKYYNTLTQQQYVDDFAKKFTDEYITTNTQYNGLTTKSEQDYFKIKTIYDYVVRNTQYDDDVYSGKYVKFSPRYNVAHSAYGAIYGFNDEDKYSIDSNKTVAGENVIKKDNQGMAVCEGFCQLFYYLCVYNGIECHLVNGDYDKDSGKQSDIHQWNYVKLDNVWYNVDTTFASKQSIKPANINDYSYFLRGSNYYRFTKLNHQQPYNYEESQQKGLLSRELYDWQNNIVVSKDSYNFKLKDVQAHSKNASINNVIMRKDKNDSAIKECMMIDQNNNYYKFVNLADGSYKYESCDGFAYNGKDEDFQIIIPYMVDDEYTVSTGQQIKDVGSYDVSISGINDSEYSVNFKIVPFNMTDHNDDYVSMLHDVNYNNALTSDIVKKNIKIIDAYNNTLEQNKDYTVTLYTDENHKNVANELSIGTYYIGVDYIGNYQGIYDTVFNVGKIDMNYLSNSTVASFDYYPKGILNNNGYSSLNDLYSRPKDKTKTYGVVTLNQYIDYNISLTGNETYGSKGYFVLTATDNSDKVIANTKSQVPYEINKKYDISQLKLDGKSACSKSFTYTGKAIYPTLDNLNRYLTKDVDYKVTYSNNINVGTATATITGINGCYGTAKMYFTISPKGYISSMCKSLKLSTTTYYFTGYSKCPTVTLYDASKRVISSSYYKVTYSNNIKVGTATVTITGANGYSGTVKTSFKIISRPVNTKGYYVRLSTTSYTYTGGAKKPTAYLYDSSKKRISSSYYKVSYSNYVNPGVATVTVTGINGYSSYIKTTFRIYPKKQTLSSLTSGKKYFYLKWKKDSTVSGYQIQYATNSKFKSSKYAYVTRNSTISYKKTSLSSKKRYYVRIRAYKIVGKTKYYGAYSSYKSIVIK